MRRINFKNVVWKEAKHYVAWNLNTGVSSFGDSKKNALASLQEALELHLENVPSSKIQKVERTSLESFILSYA